MTELLERVQHTTRNGAQANRRWQHAQRRIAKRVGLKPDLERSEIGAHLYSLRLRPLACGPWPAADRRLRWWNPAV